MVALLDWKQCSCEQCHCSHARPCMIRTSTVFIWQSSLTEILNVEHGLKLPSCVKRACELPTKSRSGFLDSLSARSTAVYPRHSRSSRSKSDDHQDDWTNQYRDSKELAFREPNQYHGIVCFCHDTTIFPDQCGCVVCGSFESSFLSGWYSRPSSAVRYWSYQALIVSRDAHE